MLRVPVAYTCNYQELKFITAFAGLITLVIVKTEVGYRSYFFAFVIFKNFSTLNFYMGELYHVIT